MIMVAFSLAPSSPDGTEGDEDASPSTVSPRPPVPWSSEVIEEVDVEENGALEEVDDEGSVDGATVTISDGGDDGGFSPRKGSGIATLKLTHTEFPGFLCTPPRQASSVGYSFRIVLMVLSSEANTVVSPLTSDTTTSA